MPDQLTEALDIAESVSRQRDEALDGYTAALADLRQALDLVQKWRDRAAVLTLDLEWYKARAVLRAGELPPSQRPPIDTTIQE